MKPTCCVLCTDPDALATSAALAQQLALPLLSADAADTDAYPLQLGVSTAQIDLRSDGLNEKNPLKVDFNDSRYQARLKRATVNNELLAKACGLKGNQSSRIIDCTAGLGQDGYLLSQLGADVTLLEQNAIVHCLLEDGLSRLANHHARPKLHHTQAQQWLQNLSEPVDVVVLDPMFPQRQKTALVKKGMQRFHQLLGHQNNDAEQLFKAAIGVLKKGLCKRVVVKRPPTAATLGNIEPHHCHSSKAARFDVYM